MTQYTISAEVLAEMIEVADALAGVADALRDLARIYFSDQPRLASDLLDHADRLGILATRALYRAELIANAVRGEA